MNALLFAALLCGTPDVTTFADGHQLTITAGEVSPKSEYVAPYPTETYYEKIDRDVRASQRNNPIRFAAPSRQYRSHVRSYSIRVN